MEVNLVGEAFKFMALGMSIVFLFLTTMMFALKVQAYIIGKFVSTRKKESVSSKKQNGKKDIAAAITAAIMHHNQNN